MANAEFHEVLAVDPGKMFKAITQYEDYPKFVEGCTSTKVERKGPGKTRVVFHVSMMKDVTYTIDHVEDEAAGTITWSLVDSDFFKKNSGKWVIKPAGDGKSDVFYAVEVDFKIPVPGFVLNRLVKGSLPPMVKSFAKRANS